MDEPKNGSPKLVLAVHPAALLSQVGVAPVRHDVHIVGRAVLVAAGDFCMVNAVRHGLHLPQLGRVPQCSGAPLPAGNTRQALSGHVVFVAVVHAAPESIKKIRRLP